MPLDVLLTTAGFQVPVTPLLDVVGKVGAVAPLQIAAIAVNVGVIFGVTVIVTDLVVAHCPVVGVNKYVPLAVLLTVAGLQVPVMPLVDVAGKVGATAPLQKAGIAAKAGTIAAFTVTFKVVVEAHCPALGANV